jgi:hypothetical protein
MKSNLQCFICTSKVTTCYLSRCLVIMLMVLPMLLAHFKEAECVKSYRNGGQGFALARGVLLYAVVIDAACNNAL